MIEIDVPDLAPHHKEKLSLALARAQAVRDFEITLYWSRTNYFWGFQVAIMAMSGLLLGPALGGGVSERLAQSVTPENEALILSLVLSALCLLGLFVSVVWTWMLEGAKFWQDNWERHIDILEDAVHGPLYKTYFVPTSKHERPTSVTKSNSIIARAFALFWGSLALLPMWLVWSSIDSVLKADMITVPLALLLYFFVVAAAKQGFKFSLQMTNFANQITFQQGVSHQLWTREALASSRVLSSDEKHSTNC